MKVILDGMGGDHAPSEIVKGAAEASHIIGEHEICIVGDERRIEDELSRHIHNRASISILHAPDIITADDSPAKSIRRKPDSSMVKGLEALRDGKGDVFLSAGNSGALMSGSVMILGRIPNIDRPAIGSPYPILEGGVALLIDAGANAECKPRNLLQFGIMGSIYAETVFGKEHPRVGLVNMGTEKGKGSPLLKESFELIDGAAGSLGLRFVGNVEARDVPVGICDVIVCDGFVGNVILKMTEGVGLSIMHLIRKKFTEGVIATIGATLLMGKLGELKKTFDYTEYGGAPVLGVTKPVVKMHGSSDSKAVLNGIIKSLAFADGHAIDAITENVAKVAELGEAEGGEAESDGGEAGADNNNGQ
ncbi:MAG: phosphate acyltransferase PlsX [Clostridiales Family XIII bacterium]|jgi:glycerol-3-phosphate acyltransferase PlsX|nr:phosphate acyltransferase PlsX [Clostridiales Family XIII bacterium]